MALQARTQLITGLQNCNCTGEHDGRRIVLTGGPGAGKTAVLELVRQYFCRHIVVLPEAASVLFGGGFPRGVRPEERKAVQRAIFFVQRELEAVARAADGAAIVMCDRGTLDGFAYWPGPEDYWDALGTTREAELQRYRAVIHLRTPSVEAGYNHDNPLRTESALEAALVDDRIATAWAGHPRSFTIAASSNFLDKAALALRLLRQELPECCRQHGVFGVELHPPSV